MRLPNAFLPPLALLSLATGGCRGDLIRPICVETDRVTVADDEATDLGFTVVDVMAWAGGAHTASGTYEDGTSAEVTVGLVRSDGVAEVVTQEEGTEREKGAGALFGDVTLDIGVICPSPTLEVPTLLTVSTDDGVVDIAVDTISVATDATTLTADVDVPTADMEGLPLPEGSSTDGSCTSGDPTEAFVDGVFTDDGSVAGQAGWDGELTCTDGSEGAWARYTLGWATEAE